MATTAVTKTRRKTLAQLARHEAKLRKEVVKSATELFITQNRKALEELARH